MQHPNWIRDVAGQSEHYNDASDVRTFSQTLTMDGSPLSKRALSMGSQGTTSGNENPPKKKHCDLNQARCSVCSEPMKEVGTAHKACTRPTVFCTYDEGKTKLRVRRDRESHSLTCSRCRVSFFSANDIARHAPGCKAKENPKNTSTKSATAHHVLSELRTSSRPSSGPLNTPLRIPGARHSSSVAPSVPSPLRLLTTLPSPTRPTSATETLSPSPSTIDHSPTPATTTVNRTISHITPFANTIQTPLLRKYGLLLNTKWRIVICAECQGIINPQDVRQHFQNQHKQFVTPLDLQEQFDVEINEKYPGLTYTPPHPTTPVDPIPGLASPADDFVLCLSCHHCYSSRKVFNKHTCASDGSTWTTSPAQRFVQTSLL